MFQWSLADLLGHTIAQSLLLNSPPKICHFWCWCIHDGNDGWVFLSRRFHAESGTFVACFVFVLSMNLKFLILPCFFALHFAACFFSLFLIDASLRVVDLASVFYQLNLTMMSLFLLFLLCISCLVGLTMAANKNKRHRALRENVSGQ